MDFTTAQSRVTDYIVDVPSETAALIDVWINNAVRAAENRYNFRHMKSTHSVTTTADTRSLGALPSDWKAKRELPWLLGDDDITAEIQWAPSPSEMIRQFDASTTLDDGEPEFILVNDETIDSSVFEVYPLPDGNSDYGDGEYRVRIPYWAYSAVLSDPSDTNRVLDEQYFGFYAVFYAAGQGLMFNENDRAAAKYNAMAEQALMEAIRLDKRSFITDRVTLTRRSDVYGRALGPRRHRLTPGSGS